MLKGKTIVLGVTGSIAAYKGAELASRLIQAGATVKVIMTEAATHFISPLTFKTLTGHPVLTSFFEEPGEKIYHLSLSKEATLFLIAPATANIIAKIVQGIADDPLTTAVLATEAPILIAPAMNERMYLNPTTQHNLNLLRSRGVIIIKPEEGFLACGEVGKGRLASVEKIIYYVEEEIKVSKALKEKTILITAGPTREPIDSVRFISNRSSGKMGYALAEEAKRQGAQVILITGSTHLLSPQGIEVVRVETAKEMHDACLNYFSKVDAVVMAAAVADYRPEKTIEGKIKKAEDSLSLKLVKSEDILMEMGKRKKNQMLVGFALETENLVERAKEKLKAKNLDLIVANEPTQAFGEETNQVTLIDKSGKTEKLPLLSKREIARHILAKLAKMLGTED